MNNATKKVLPVILLATVFSTASAVATESKNNTLLTNSDQCAAGEIVINSNQIIYATNTDSLIKHEVNTETLFTSIVLGAAASVFFVARGSISSVAK